MKFLKLSIFLFLQKNFAHSSLDKIESLEYFDEKLSIYQYKNDLSLLNFEYKFQRT